MWDVHNKVTNQESNASKDCNASKWIVMQARTETKVEIVTLARIEMQ